MILVSIPSRNRLVELYKMIEQLYLTCADEGNFDIQIVIDKNQRALYHPILNDFPRIIYTEIEWGRGSWLNIFNAQHEYFLKASYDFLWVLPDDMTGLYPNWDREILSRKKTFEDDLFVLYTDGAQNWGRTKNEHEICYISEDGLNMHEPNPVWTKKWCEYLAPLFQGNSKYIVYREMMIAGLLKILYGDYGINRNVHVDINWNDIKNDRNSQKYNQCWLDLVSRDLDDLKPVARAMVTYIEENARIGG